MLAHDGGVRRPAAGNPRLVDHARVHVAEVAAALLPPQVCGEMHRRDPREVVFTLDEQPSEAVRRRREGVERPFRLHADVAGDLAREVVRKKAAVRAPRAVEGVGDACAPLHHERRPRLGHDERVRARRPGAVRAGIEDVALAPDHAGLLPQLVARRRDERGVDVGVHAAVLGEHVEAHEVGLVCVRVVRDDRVVVRELGDLAHGVDTVERDERPHEVPVEAVRKLVAVEVDLVGPHDLPARCDREVVDQVERLVLGTEAEYEVDDVGDSSGHTVGRDRTEGAPTRCTERPTSRWCWSPR